MRVLVTGAGGVVGGAIRDRLQGDYELAAPPHGEALAALKNFKPHTVIHAAWGGSDGSQRNNPALLEKNRQFSMDLLEAAAKAGAKRWITFGSQAEYSPGLRGAIAEDAPTQPATAYGAAKLALCEEQREFCAASGIAFFWLRLFSCYSARQKPPYLIPSLIESWRRGEVPTLKTPQAVEDFLHADDMAEGVARLVAHEDTGGIYNLASGRGVAVGEVARLIPPACGGIKGGKSKQTPSALTAPLPPTPSGFGGHSPNPLPHAGEGMSRIADITKFSTTFGWQPHISIEDGLKALVAAG